MWHLEEEKYSTVAVNAADAVPSRFVNPTSASVPTPTRAACSNTTSRSVEGGSDSDGAGAAGVDTGDGAGVITRMSGRLSRRLLLRPGLLESAAAAGAAAAVNSSPRAPAQ